MRRIVSGLCLFGLLLTAIAAQAETDAAKAASRTLLKQGNERLDRGKFQDALEKFLQAYDRFPSPKIFFSQGQALRGLNRNADALRAFQRFLDEAKGASQEYQSEARGQVAELTARVGRVEIHSNRTGARIGIDGQEVGLAPLAAPIWVDPGLHHVTAEWQDANRSDLLNVAAGQPTVAHLDFEPKPALLSIHCNREGALVRTNTTEQGMTPLANPLPLHPGTHRLTVEWQGEKRTLDLSLVEGEVVSRTVDFEQRLPSPTPVIGQPAPAQPVPAARAWYRSPWVWAAAGAVVVGTGVTLIWVYGRSDRFPTPNMGTQPVRD